MAAHDSKPEVSISKAQQRMKVGYASVRHKQRATKNPTYYSCCPSLHLKGDRLEEAGFGTDTPITVNVEHGQLVIGPVVE